MGSPDFFRRHAETPWLSQFRVMGRVCTITTNSQALLEAAASTLDVCEQPDNRLDLSMRLWVDEASRTRHPWPQPYVRGLGHLVYIGLDPKSSMMVNLQARRVIGRLSSAMASDERYWKMTILPILMSVVAGSTGLVELHASSVACADRGLILLGPTRSGKSTLAMAFLERGFRLLSDDRTFCSVDEDTLLAYGLPRPLKLRREAGHWFDEFRHQEPQGFQNGEPVFYRSPGSLGNGPLHAPCEPQAAIVLDRQPVNGFRATPMSPSEFRNVIEADLLSEDAAATQAQEAVLNRLLQVPCWRLQYGGSPQAIASQICDFLSCEH